MINEFGKLIISFCILILSIHNFNLINLLINSGIICICVFDIVSFSKLTKLLIIYGTTNKLSCILTKLIISIFIYN